MKRKVNKKRNKAVLDKTTKAAFQWIESLSKEELDRFEEIVRIEVATRLMKEYVKNTSSKPTKKKGR